MNMDMRRGFTLVELLIVLAVIGVLASIVVSTLSSAKKKASDSSLKSGLSTIRSQGEYYNTVNGSYVGSATAFAAAQTSDACLTAGSLFNTTDGMGNNLQKLSDTYDPLGWSLTCAIGDTPDSWAVSSPLKMGDTWCVDYTGASKNGVASGGGPGAEAKCL